MGFVETFIQSKQRQQTKRSSPDNGQAAIGLFADHVLGDYEERISILEYDGNMPRQTAERKGYQMMIDKYGERAFKKGV